MIRLKNQKRILSFFVIFIMLLSAFIGIAGATDENTESENDEDEVRTGAIVGKVLNVENEPLAGVIVHLIHGAEQSNPDKVRKLETKTNERGYFEFSELPRGIYLIQIHERGYEPWRDDVKVPAGETIELKIVLKKTETEPEKDHIIVHGIVYNALNEEPIAGAFVGFFNQWHDEIVFKTETNEEGMFKLRMPVSKYIIMVEARGFEPYRDELPINDRKEIELKIPLKPHRDEPEEERPSLCGRIFDAETDEPIAGWVELSFGNPKIEPAKRPKMQDKEFNNDDDKKRERDFEHEEKDNDDEKEEKDRERERDREEKDISRSEDRKEKEDERQREDEKDWDNDERPERPDMPERPEKPEDFFLWRTYSDREGFYEYFDVPAGHYEMRVFARGHVMYYNEINIEEGSLYIDVYLLREKKQPTKPMALIGGRVIDSTTNEPIAGAIVCVLPPEVFNKKANEMDLDLKELGLEADDLDMDNIDFDTEMEITFVELTDEDIDINIDKEKVNVEIKEIAPKQKPNTANEQKRDTRSNPDNKPKKETDSAKPQERPDKPESPKDKLRKFCTRTDAEGYFKLKVPAGAHVMLVKADGYRIFARKFEIKPTQMMKVEIPMIPRVNDALSAKANEAAKDGEETSDTASLGSSVTSGVASSSSILSASLGVLSLIALGLFALVGRKNGLFKRKKK